MLLTSESVRLPEDDELSSVAEFPDNHKPSNRKALVQSHGWKIFVGCLLTVLAVLISTYSALSVGGDEAVGEERWRVGDDDRNASDAPSLDRRDATTTEQWLSPAPSPTIASGGASTIVASTLSPELVEVLSELTDAATLRDADSPQSRAAVWLDRRRRSTDHDDDVEVNEDDDDRARLLQRYSLATLFLSVAEDGTYGASKTAAAAKSAARRPVPDLLPDEPDWYHTYAHECGWVGVECDQDRRVVSIDLEHARLVGTLPSELGDAALPTLRYLGLTNNGLTGTLPSSWSRSLEEVRLGRNAFAGRVPTGLGRLPRLRALDLSRNRLTGETPPTLLWSNDTAATLERLWLSRNELNGTLPVPPEGAGERLLSLMLDHNRFTGTIPDGLNRLTDLKTLDLTSNELEGTVPAALTELTGLRHLRLADNDLTGSLPPSFCVDVRERLLSFTVDAEEVECDCCPVVVASDSFAPSPTALIYDPNSAHTHRDVVLHTVSSVTPPEVLADESSPQYRAVSWLSDRLVRYRLQAYADPSSLVRSYALATTLLATSGTADALPPSLHDPDARECDWPGVGCAEDDGGTTATVVSLSSPDAPLSGTLPDEIVHLTRLETLDLSGHRLRGTLPARWPASLRELSLRDNELTGAPPAFDDAPVLEVLDVRGNALAGPLPAASATRRTWLSDNEFEGTLSESFLARSASSLDVRVDRNRLTGTLPAALGNGTRDTEFIDLSHNDFRGTIPSELGQLSRLIELRLQGNPSLSGTVPTEICALEGLTLRLEDTGVTCSCCPDDSATATATASATRTPDSAKPSPEATWSSAPTSTPTNAQPRRKRKRKRGNRQKQPRPQQEEQANSESENESDVVETSSTTSPSSRPSAIGNNKRRFRSKREEER